MHRVKMMMVMMMAIMILIIKGNIEMEWPDVIFFQCGIWICYGMLIFYLS